MGRGGCAYCFSVELKFMQHKIYFFFFLPFYFFIFVVCVGCLLRVGFSLITASRGYSVVAQALMVMASLVAEHGV